MGCNGSKEKKEGEEPAVAEAPRSVSEEDVEVKWKSIHSAIRWNKSPEEVGELVRDKDAANARDTGNGNLPLHIAAQNGHFDLVKLLVEKGAEINGQNNKLNTPLHMSLGYDYIDVSEYLIKSGADLNIENSTGVPARRGIDGDKCLGAVYLGEAQTTADLMSALKMCDESVGDLDKASFARVALRLKKSLGPEIWTDEVQNTFKAIVMKL